MNIDTRQPHWVTDRTPGVRSGNMWDSLSDYKCDIWVLGSPIKMTMIKQTHCLATVNFYFSLYINCHCLKIFDAVDWSFEVF